MSAHAVDVHPIGRRGAPRSSWHILGELVCAQRGKPVPWLLVTMIFLEVALDGGDRREIALTFAGVQTLGLAALLWRSTRAGRALAVPSNIKYVALLYAALLAVLFSQFLPFAHGLSKASWAYIAGAPSITLDRFATAVEMAKLIGYAALFGCGLVISGQKGWANSVLDALVLGGGVYTVWAIAGFYLQGWGVQVSGDGRLMASLPTPNVCAGVLGALATVSWNQTLRNRPLVREHVHWQVQMLSLLTIRTGLFPIVTLAELWALSLTASRAGAVSIACALVLITAVWSLLDVRSGLRLEKLRSNWGLLSIGCLLALISANPLGTRLAAAGAQTDRSRYFGLYLSHLTQAPLTGYGLGTFKHFNPMLLKPAPGLYTWELGAMHNIYLQWIYEAGPFGAGLMFCLIGAVLLAIASALRRQSSGRSMLIASLGVSTMLVVHSAVDIDLQFPALASLWALLLGLAYGLTAGSRARS